MHAASEAEIISVHVASHIDGTVLAAMPRLRHIACRSTGYDNVDLRACIARGITVSTVPAYGVATVAEYTFMLTLALTRKLLPTIQAVSTGMVNPDAVVGMDLSGKTMGIAGLGRIGQHVAQIANGFGMTILAYDVHHDLDLAATLGVEYTTLLDLLKRSDVVSLHMPATLENKHIINAEKLALMKPTAYLINTARGMLVDTQALTLALQAKQLAGAGLDVVEGERFLHGDDERFLLTKQSLKEDVVRALAISMLARMPNAIVTSHNAYNSREALDRIQQTTLANILAFQAGSPTNLAGATS